MNGDVVPDFVIRETLIGVVISAIAGNYRDCVSTLGETPCKIGKMLGRRYDVRVKTLVKKEVLQSSGSQ